MHVCLCHNFNEAKVIKVIKDHPDIYRVRDVHEICSGKPDPQCGKCLTTIKGMLEEQGKAPCMKPAK